MVLHRQASAGTRSSSTLTCPARVSNARRTELGRSEAGHGRRNWKLRYRPRAAAGLAFNFDKQARTPNTLDSHRVIWLAGKRGVQDAVAEALFLAYFTDGRDLSERNTLAEVAAGAGLNCSEVDELLAGGEGWTLSAPVRRMPAGSACWTCRSSSSTAGSPYPVPNRRNCSGRRSSRCARRSWEACEVDPATGKQKC